MTQVQHLLHCPWKSDWIQDFVQRLQSIHVLCGKPLICLLLQSSDKPLTKVLGFSLLVGCGSEPDTLELMVVVKTVVVREVSSWVFWQGGNGIHGCCKHGAGVLNINDVTLKDFAALRQWF